MLHFLFVCLYRKYIYGNNITKNQYVKSHVFIGEVSKNYIKIDAKNTINRLR